MNQNNDSSVRTVRLRNIKKENGDIRISILLDISPEHFFRTDTHVAYFTPSYENVDTGIPESDNLRILTIEKFFDEDSFVWFLSRANMRMCKQKTTDRFTGYVTELRPKHHKWLVEQFGGMDPLFQKETILARSMFELYISGELKEGREAEIFPEVARMQDTRDVGEELTVDVEALQTSMTAGVFKLLDREAYHAAAPA